MRACCANRSAGPEPTGSPFWVMAAMFEIAGIILLVAIIAAITLTVRQRPMVKRQNPSHQVKVKASDRVRLVNMPVENPED